jgi:hypothetical protein
MTRFKTTTEILDEMFADMANARHSGNDHDDVFTDDIEDLFARARGYAAFLRREHDEDAPSQPQTIAPVTL